jgi:hypothetical protein
MRWTAESAGIELGFHHQTILNRLVASGVIPGEDGCYALQQITDVMFGDLHKQRLRRTIADADGKELHNRQFRGEYLLTEEIEKSVTRVLELIAQSIKGSSMPWDEKDRIMRHLQDLPLGVEEVKAKTISRQKSP